jgi:signal peptidase
VVRRAATVVPALLVLLLAPVVVAVVGAWAQGWTLASVTTGSMRPGTPAGSMVVLAPVSPADVEVGDVIGYRDDRLGAVVTHRVAAVLDQPSGRYFTTQGDANPRPDARPVAARDVVGEVRWRIAGLGSVVGAIGERSVQLAVAGVPFALLVASEVVGWRGRRLGRLVGALRAEIEVLRTTDRHPDRAPERVVVVRVRDAVVVPSAGRRVPTDGTACVAGLR